MVFTEIAKIFASNKPLAQLANVIYDEVLFKLKKQNRMTIELGEFVKWMNTIDVINHAEIYENLLFGVDIAEYRVPKYLVNLVSFPRSVRMDNTQRTKDVIQHTSLSKADPEECLNVESFRAVSYKINSLFRKTDSELASLNRVDDMVSGAMSRIVSTPSGVFLGSQWKGELPVILPYDVYEDFLAENESELSFELHKAWSEAVNAQ